MLVVCIMLIVNHIGLFLDAISGITTLEENTDGTGFHMSVVHITLGPGVIREENASTVYLTSAHTEVTIRVNRRLYTRDGILVLRRTGDLEQ